MFKRALPDCLWYCKPDSLTQPTKCVAEGIVKDEVGREICRDYGMGGGVHGLTVMKDDPTDPQAFDLMLIFTAGPVSSGAVDLTRLCLRPCACAHPFRALRERSRRGTRREPRGFRSSRSLSQVSTLRSCAVRPSGASRCGTTLSRSPMTSGATTLSSTMPVRCDGAPTAAVAPASSVAHVRRRPSCVAPLAVSVAADPGPL